MLTKHTLYRAFVRVMMLKREPDPHPSVQDELDSILSVARPDPLVLIQQMAYDESDLGRILYIKGYWDAARRSQVESALLYQKARTMYDREFGGKRED